MIYVVIVAVVVVAWIVGFKEGSRSAIKHFDELMDTMPDDRKVFVLRAMLKATEDWEAANK